jgi:hypothetical protein
MVKSFVGALWFMVAYFAIDGHSTEDDIHPGNDGCFGFNWFAWKPLTRVTSSPG